MNARTRSKALREGYFYKGTETRARLGDQVRLSKTYGEVTAEVVGLHGFITVKFLQDSNWVTMDLDARSMTFIARA